MIATVPVSLHPADSLARALGRHGGDLAVVLAGRCLTALGSVVGVRLLTEALSPTLFGRYKLVLAGLSLVFGVLVRPFIQYAMRAYHDAAESGSAARFLDGSRRRFGRFVGVLGVAAVAGGYLLAGGRPLSLPELAGVGGVLALQSLVEFDRGLFVARGRQRAAEAIAVATRWLIPIAVAALVRLDASLWVILAAHAAVLAVVASARRRDRPLGARRPADGAFPQDGLVSASAWAYAWPLMVGGVLNWLLHESDRFFLGYFHGSGAVGLYAAAYGLVAAPFTLAVGAAAQVMYPVVFAASARRGRALVLPAPLLAGTLLIGAGGVAAVWWGGDGLAAVVLAEEYRAGVAGLLAWIATGYACFGVATCFDLGAYGSGRTKYLMASSGAAATANVGLNLWLVPARGAAGAAVATAAALFVYLACMAALFWRGTRRGPSAVVHSGDDREPARVERPVAVGD